MAGEWTEWQKLEEPSEYIHWFRTDQPGEDNIAAEPGDPNDLTLLQVATTDQAKGVSPILPGTCLGSELFQAGVAVPQMAANTAFLKGAKVSEAGWLPPADDIPGGVDENGAPMIDDYAIIMGIIDVGIPLGHNRWRHTDGTTRILSAWQMLADWGTRSQGHLPFGREVYEADINRLLEEHSGGSLKGWLDEAAFNTATGVRDMHNTRGPRHAAGHASHGAHVMDAAAGCDPDANGAEAEFRNKVKIIAVNVPSASIFGASGTYLDDFLRLAVQRVVDMADAIWMKNHPDYQHDPDGERRAGYKIVINMSFGKQAGAKDFSDPFSGWLRDLREERWQNNLSSVMFTMPSGNDNVERCNAFLEPKQAATETLGWRVLPEDQSSNFAEVWTALDDVTEPPIAVDLAPPSGLGNIGTPGLPALLDGYGCYCDLKEGSAVLARIYARAVPADRESKVAHLKYTLAMPPTLRLTGDQAAGIAGRWQIAVTNNASRQVQAALSIQTDQQTQPTRPINQRSYFDDPGYSLHDEAGRLTESYTYPPDAIENRDRQADTPVRRHGTMNASAAHMAVATVGGYRVSDGRPAIYSATGRGHGPTKAGEIGDDGTTLVRKEVQGQRLSPTAALPTEDGPAHFGILAAGANNGSVVAMRGTSFASSQAARVVAQSLIDDDKAEDTARERLIQKAKQSNAQSHSIFGYPHHDALREILGAGRIPSPLITRVERRG